ncbi:co-chaperone YbbN [Pseudactinotalea sp. Z1748]|uniref:co-chaperone YbbN n=1 Tax=Pseudactinotalea sp. Z1748 TaxID=3413027 RepID=UPI003C7B0F26
MSQPSINLRGAVDLSSLSAPPSPPGGEAPSSGGGAVVDVTLQSFQEVVQRSVEVPVIIDLRSPRSPASGELSATLQTLAGEYGGRFLLARADVDAYPQIAQAFQVQGAPAVCAVIKGQPLPLFQGPQPLEQIRAVIDEVLRVAAENGVTGKVEGVEEPAEDEDGEEAAEEPLPPHIQAAYDAIENDDLDAAAEAFEQGLRENPADAEAKAGLAQVDLGRRLSGLDIQSVLTTVAQAASDDVEAHLAAADVEAASGQIEQAFSRLISLVRVTAGDDRERARKRLLELFLIVPEGSPELLKARRELAVALY